jgi:hypothetical protein
MVCMIPNCFQVLREREIEKAVGPQKLNMFQRLSLEQVASIDAELRICPFPDCGMIFSLNERKKKKLEAEFLILCQGG